MAGDWPIGPGVSSVYFPATPPKTDLQRIADALEWIAKALEGSDGRV